MQRSGRRRVDWPTLWGLLGLLALIGLLWHTWLVYPLKLLVVLFHELSHGLAALLTGGSVLRIELAAQEGGLCVTQDGSPFLVLSAGYLGSLLWGGALLLIATRTRVDRIACGALGVLLLLAALLWVRPLLSFGFGFTVLVGLALLLAGVKLKAEVCDFLLKLAGLTSVLYVPLDIFSDTLARPQLPSDARLLAELTGLPTMVWGALWVTLAVAGGFWLLRLAVLPQPVVKPRYRPQSRPRFRDAR